LILLSAAWFHGARAMASPIWKAGWRSHWPGIRYECYLRGSLTLGYQLFDSASLIVQAQGGTSPYLTSISRSIIHLFLFHLVGVAMCRQARVLPLIWAGQWPSWKISAR